MPSHIHFDSHAVHQNRFRKFTSWIPWEARKEEKESIWNEHRISAFPGVYLLAHFASPPKDAADFTDDAIIYVGEGGHLQRRWYDFERSAFHCKSGHSGGLNYHAKFGTKHWSKLHVAVLPIWFGDGDTPPQPLTRNFQHAAERYVLWSLTVARNGKGTLLNRK